MNIVEPKKMSSNQSVTCDENITDGYNNQLLNQPGLLVNQIKRSVCQNFSLSTDYLSLK